MWKPSNRSMSRADEEETSIRVLRKRNYRSDNIELELVKEDEIGMK